MIRDASISARVRQSSPAPWMIAMLMIGFIMPFSFNIGTVVLSMYRVVLLAAAVPVAIRIAQGAAGRFNTVDVVIILFSIFSALSILVNEGFRRWEFMGVLQVEILIPYFMARTMIRDLGSYRYFVKWYVIAVLLMLPFAVYESLTSQEIVLEFFGKFLNVYREIEHRLRFGLDRAQVSMPHPILFGMFCSSAFGLAWFVLGHGKSLGKKASICVPIGVAVFTSLSTGAFLAVAIQMMLMAWQRIFSFFKYKWKFLIGLFAIFYLFIELFSTRSPAQIFAKLMTINSSSAWYRIHQFTYAKDDVINNPIFGLGFRDWTRPNWMIPSVDNFWLALTLRYGLPASILLLVAVVMVFRKTGRKPLHGALESARNGYLFTLAGLSISALSVHLWEATFCLFMLLIGSGIWLIDARKETASEEKQETKRKKKNQIRYTRFG